jgi:uncharacterized protein (TIGR03067 family)
MCQRRGSMRLHFLSVIAVALLWTRAPVLAEEKKDQDEPQGTWEVTALFADGKPEADKAKGTILVIKGEKITLVASEGKIKRNFTFTLDSAKKPKAIDAVAQDGAAAGKTILGIYEVKGGALTWCMSGEPDGKRPTELAPKEGDKALILTAKRAKP